MITRRLIANSFLASLLVVAIACLGGADGAEAQAKEDRELRVKAAFLYNFINLPMRFVVWPERAFPDETAPIMIGIVGRDPFRKALDNTMRGKRINGRAIVIKRLGAFPPRDDDPALASMLTELKRCHLVFVCASERRQSQRICALLASAPVLTVSDIPSFAERGGMIELALDKGRVKPLINVRMAERSRLRFGSKLLELATLVESRP